MAAVGTLGAQADLPERQCDVIDDDQQVVQFDVLLDHPVAHGLPAQVHVGRWLEQHKLLVLETHLGYGAITSGRENSIGCLGECIQYCKSYVVAGPLVLGTNVSQADNEILHRVVDELM